MKVVLDSSALKVAKGVNEEPGRPVLNCVKIEDGEIAAADGYMLVRKAVKIEGNGSMLIPGKTLRKASSALVSENLLITSENGIDMRKPNFRLRGSREISLNTTTSIL